MQIIIFLFMQKDCWHKSYDKNVLKDQLQQHSFISNKVETVSIQTESRAQLHQKQNEINIGLDTFK